MINWGNPYEYNAENYYIDFYGNTAKSSGWVSTMGNNYITCNTYNERVHHKAGNINPYKFSKDFDLNYFRLLFSNNLINSNFYIGNQTKGQA